MATQWTVTYTRHKSQKRKIYHDGILALQCFKSNQKKVLLYDDCGKLLDYRFLRNCEEVEIGRSLEFDSVLVEICDTVEKESCFVDITNGEREVQTTKERDFHKGVCKGPGFPKVKVVEGTKEMVLGVNESEADMKEANSEWHVLYTKHKKQRTKKYFDGILQLLVLGVRKRQVILSSDDGNILDKRYLSCQEDVKSNCTLELGEYIVEVGEPKFCQTDSENCMTNSNETVSRFGYESSVESRESDKMTRRCKDASLHNAKVLESITFEQEVLERSNIDLDSQKHMDGSKVHTWPIRTVNQILTVLKKPALSKDNIQSAIAVDPILKSSTSQSIKESYGPNVLTESSKVGAYLECLFKEDVSKHDTKNDCNSENACQEICVKKSLYPCLPLESEKSFSIPTTRSLKVKHSGRNFRVPTLQFNPSIQHLVFPNDNTEQMFRQVHIPNKFPSLASYRHIMSSAVYEEINLILFDIANDFHKAKQGLSNLSKQRPQCMHGNGRLQIVKKDGPNKGRLFYGCPSQVESCLFYWADVKQVETDISERFNEWSADELEHAFSCFDIDFYADCEMFSRKTASYLSKKRRRDEYEYGDDVVGLERTSTYLKLRSTRKEKRSTHSKSDLWIICSNIKFSKERRDDFVAFAVNDYNGLSSNGILEVSFLEGKPYNMPSKKAFALHGPCIQSELAMLNILRDMHTSSIPLLPLLLQCSTNATENVSTIEIEKLADQFILKYNLNEDQAQVVRLVGKWFVNSDSRNTVFLSSQPEICLVHGIFGSGKSYLLTVIVIFLTSISKRWEANMRILISAATNVAIDRILTGLLELGFDNFIRVGSIKKIARNILRYSVYGTSEVNSAEDATLKEMQEYLTEACAFESLEIKEEIKYLKDGKMAKRREKMEDAQVVGVTCYSTINPILKGNKFQICILDECAQIPEPLSLLPISQFGCVKLIAVGDPAQLPPALNGGSDLCKSQDTRTSGRKHNENCSFELDEKKTTASTSFHDLRRSLFVRLVEMGYDPVMLRTQYRCHPRLITAPNELFYGGRIISGCREIDRPPLLPALPPLLFWDTCNHGSEVKDSFKSYSNLFEAKLLCKLIMMMLERGILKNQIGVVLLYKSQVLLVQELLYQGYHSKEVKVKRSKSNEDLENQELEISMNCGDVNIVKHGHPVRDIQISTVDAFQGMEKDIIILSCCRTKGLGFLSSPNRINVALTRARNHLIIIGKASNLQRSQFWGKLLSIAGRMPGSYISTPESESGLEMIINRLREHKDFCDPVVNTNEQNQQTTIQSLQGVANQSDDELILHNGTASAPNNCNTIYVGGCQDQSDEMDYVYNTEESKCDEAKKFVSEILCAEDMSVSGSANAHCANGTQVECNDAPTFELGL